MCRCYEGTTEGFMGPRQLQQQPMRQLAAMAAAHARVNGSMCKTLVASRPCGKHVFSPCGRVYGQPAALTGHKVAIARVAEVVASRETRSAADICLVVKVATPTGEAACS